MLTRDLQVKIDLDTVMHLIDCNKDSDLYEEFVEEFQEMEGEMYALCDPVFLMEYSTIGPELAGEDLPVGTPVLMVLYSVGRGMSAYSTKAFAQGDYVKGMLADAMADSALFSLEKYVVSFLKEECGSRHMGIRCRLQAPKDIPMEANKILFELLGAREKCGMEISSGYMLDPVKSGLSVYVLTDDEELFFHQHNCRKCDRYNCKSRRIPDIPVRVRESGRLETVMVREGQSILDALMEADPGAVAVCGGTGRCGKCKIRVLEGKLPVTVSDREFFTEKELQEGMRLSCRAFPEDPVEIQVLFRTEESFQTLTDFDISVINKRRDKIPESVDGKPAYGVAVDIGTTTIAMQLIDLHTGDALGTYTGINHQRSYGADVISRIKADMEGKGPEMRALIQKDLAEGIRRVVEKAGVNPVDVKEILLAGNTTMGHLLMGYDCKGLGVYPFTPVNIGPVEGTFEELIGAAAEDPVLGALRQTRVCLMPGISAFVGGDIVAGLQFCGVDESDAYSLLIDLGTNGEIALGNRDGILTTSTAAGPAFEGGNITWGVGSIEGAIAGVTIQDGLPRVRTIGNKPAVGICGTGVVETVAELIRAELVDETGCLDEDYFDDGFPLALTPEGEEIVFTQQDVREVQLAKAAVRAGIETLILRSGLEKDRISRVYLAGGFGFQLDCGKAVEIGMIPEEFMGKITAVGNSSLGGAIKCLLSEKSREQAAAIGARAREINLSADKDFNQFYMEYMLLERT